MKKQIVCILLFSYLVVNNFCFGQVEDSILSSEENMHFFDSQEVLQIKLEYSQKNLKKNTKDSIYTISQIMYKNTNEEWGTVDVELKARGNFRRETCYFPPVLIKIKKTSSNGTIFEGHSKLKLVLPCLKTKNSNDDVLKEFIAYKLFEVISPYHFRTRMLQVDFDDTNDNKEENYSLVGFLIEDDKIIAKRENGNLIKRFIHPQAQDDIGSIRSDLFQFMIGNVDFSTGYQHNCKLIYIDNKILPVPYDFDMSGFVDPSYGVLPDMEGTPLGITDIKDRLYRGFKRDEESFQKVRQEFISHKNDMLQILQSFEKDFTNPKEYKRAENYIQSFFKVIENDNRFKSEVILAARDN